MTTPHDTFRAQLLDLAYGELGRREARALRAHLDLCDECRSELVRITATRSAMSELGTVAAPERGEAVLFAAAREAARARARKPFLPSWVWGASIGAVAAAAAVVLSVKLAPGTRPDLQHAPTELAGSSTGDEELAERHEGPEGMLPAPPAPAPKDGVRANRRERARELAKADEGPALEKKSEPQRAPKPALPARKRAAPPEEDRFAAAPPPAPARPVGGAPPAPAESAAPSASAAPEPRADDVARAPQAAKPLARSEAPAAAEPEADTAEAPADRVAGGMLADRSAKAKGEALSLGAEDPIAVHGRLAAAGALRAETRVFEDCPGEAVRVVESDRNGRVVKVTRRGTAASVAYVLEQFYGEDGALAAVRWSSGGRVDEVRLGSGGAAGAAGVVGAIGAMPAFALEHRLAAAAAAAPPRCGE